MIERSLKEPIRSGELTIGLWMHVLDPAIAEIAGYTGFDLLIIDTEHVSGELDYRTENVVRAADTIGTVPIIRVYDANPKRIMRALDIGAQGVVVPHVQTRENMVEIVRATRYPPEGNRGSCPIIRATQYGNLSWPDYCKSANEKIIVLPIIEDNEGLANVEEIVSVQGIDAVIPGLFDLSMSLGFSGRTDHHLVQEALDKISDACKQKGVPIAEVVIDVESMKKAFERGTRMFIFSNDASIFYKICKRFVKEAKSVVQMRAHDMKDITS